MFDNFVVFFFFILVIDKTRRKKNVPDRDAFSMLPKLRYVQFFYFFWNHLMKEREEQMEFFAYLMNLFFP